MAKLISSSTERSESIRRLFCILDPEKILEMPRKRPSPAPEYWTPTLENFRVNLTSIIHTANTPFLAVKANVIVGEINKRLRNHPPDRLLSIYDVQSDLLSSLDRPDEAAELFEEIYIQLEQHTKIRSLYESYGEIHAQAVVMTAGALETFFTDTFVQLFNRFPKLAAKFLCAPSIKKTLPKSRIDIEDIARMDFVLRDKMGEYVFSERRIDSISFFRKACEVTFGKKPEDPEKRIERIFQKRHVIVHRRGRPDKKYADEAGLGETPPKIAISPLEIEQSLRAAWNIALETGKLLNAIRS